MKKKMSHEQVQHQMVSMMLYNIKSIYNNHSSDEYKMKGDITKSPVYKSVEKMIADLRTLKMYPQNEATEITTMFNTLHKPIFKEMVSKYLHRADETNSLYTAMYTVGYRVLVGELSRIYASTKATDTGLLYLPDKISRRNDIAPFIKSFNTDLNKKIDDYIKTKHDNVNRLRRESFEDNIVNAECIQEMEIFFQEAGLNDNPVIATLNKIIDTTIGAIGWIFKGFREINPISFMNACLMHSYQKKVDSFYETAATYEATKKAYDNYMKLPAAKRNPKVEEKYRQNIEKYNIAMEQKRAMIKDFDSRALEEKEKQENKFPEVDPNGGPNKPKVPSMYDDEPEDDKTSDKTSSNSSSETPPSGDDFGF